MVPRILAICLAAAGCIAWAIVSSGSDRTGLNEHERLIADKSAVVCTVKFVLQTRYEDGDDYEQESEATGIVVDPSGMVLCSSSALEDWSFLDEDMPETRAKDLRILFGDDQEGVEAKIVARDRELDLVWLGLKNPDKRKHAHVELTKAVLPRPGERLFTLARLDKYFDRAAAVYEGRIAGIVQKPRLLLAPDIGFPGETGLPVFAPDGSFAGVLVAQMPEREDHANVDSGMFWNGMGVFILPAEAVAKATARASETRNAE